MSFVSWSNIQFFYLHSNCFNHGGKYIRKFLQGKYSMSITEKMHGAYTHLKKNILNYKQQKLQH